MQGKTPKLFLVLLQVKILLIATVNSGHMQKGVDEQRNHLLLYRAKPNFVYYCIICIDSSGYLGALKLKLLHPIERGINFVVL